MPGAAGLYGQFGYAAESTPGTAVTVDHFVPFNSEAIKYSPIIRQGMGIDGTGGPPKGSRRRVAGHQVDGPVAMNFSTNSMGLLISHAIGSTPTVTQQGVTTAYKQVHANGVTDGKSLTVQVGRPESSDGVSKPFTYAGMKIVSWDLVIPGDGSPVTFAPTFDGWTQATGTSLATASIVSGSNTFDGYQVSALTLGGTATTGSGVVSIGSGVNISTLIRSLTIHGENPSRTDRRGLNNTGVKREQKRNDRQMFTVTFDAEFDTRTEFYDLLVAGTTTALHVQLQGATIASTYKYEIDIVIPMLGLEEVTPGVGGPDFTDQPISTTVLADGTNAELQINLTSTDTAI